jgi:uncharacterized protein (DUF433 family)
MARAEERRIVDGDLMDQPHVRGRRISVLMVADRVEKRGLEPATVADSLDLDITAVYEALLYYHENPARFAALREEKETTLDTEDTDKYPAGVVADDA